MTDIKKEIVENVSKSQFVNFLLKEKYQKESKESPIIQNQIQALKAPEFLMDFNCEFKIEELYEFLEKLNNLISEQKLDEIFNDLIFTILYCSPLFIKESKKKDFKFIILRDFYKNYSEINKNILKSFNMKDQGKININKGKDVVTRFPPEANGYLHIGHVKAALLNAEMAKGGQLLVRFDDTNPEKEDAEYEKCILEDLKLLKITNYKLVRSSDHFDQIYKYAILLIENGKAYCDNTEQEKMRLERMEGIESKNRNLSVEENLKIFKEMNEGKATDYCLRAKIDYKNVNKALRDPVIYRYVNKEHYITGNKYKIYPTYDFTCPIVDSLDGVTLTLRTNEYRDRNAQYYWFIDNLKLENKPKIHDFSRLNFENTVLSKRQIKFYVENDFVQGWDDPRLCTLRGIKRQGMHMEALCDYILMQGSSQKSSTISWDKIWTINKRKIDLISPRFSAVPENNSVQCFIYDGYISGKYPLGKLIEEIEISIPRHKKNLDLKEKSILFSNQILISQEDAQVLQNNEEFTLMNWGNAIVKEKIIENEIVKKINLILNLKGDYKTTKNKITWISKKGSVFIKIYEYGNLQNESTSENLSEKFNKDSKKEEWWIAESDINSIKEDDFIQIERIGFFRCDKSMEFNLIPFTKQKRKN